mgnify:CR=1 FL=1
MLIVFDMLIISKIEKESTVKVKNKRIVYNKIIFFHKNA